MLWHTQQGRGPDLVLVHGWGMHAGIWGDLPNLLAARFRVTTLDLPGHGRSHDAFNESTLTGFTDAVVQVSPASAIWLGWSLGGLIALDAARRYPEKVSKLLLVSATPKFVQAPDWPHAVQAEVFAGFARSLERDYRATLLRFLSLQIGGDETTRMLLKTLRGQIFEHGEPRAAALAAGLSILQQSDLRAALGQIQIPAVIVHGSHDRLAMPAAGEYLAAHLARANIIRIAGAGHAPFLSHAAAFTESVLREAA